MQLFWIILKTEMLAVCCFFLTQATYLFSFFSTNTHTGNLKARHISAFTPPPQINPSRGWSWLLIPIKIMALLLPYQHSCLSLLRQGKKTIEAKCITSAVLWKEPESGGRCRQTGSVLIHCSPLAAWVLIKCLRWGLKLSLKQKPQEGREHINTYKWNT